jgi:hypothetical protein
MAKDAIDKLVDWQMKTADTKYSRPMFEILAPMHDYDARARWTPIEGWIIPKW